MDSKVNSVGQAYVHFRMTSGIVCGARPTRRGRPGSIEFAELS